MKTLVVALLVAACLAACVHGYPGSRDSSSSSSSSSSSLSSSLSSSSSDESDEKKNVDMVLVLPPEARRHFGRPVLDMGDSSDIDDSFEGLFPSYPYFRNPLSSPGFFDSFLQSMESRMKRFWEQMAGILSRVPDRDVVSWGKIPEGANTTSTTKIIDGHVVTINETTYMDGDDEHGILTRVRIISVKPQNDTILLTESAADAEVTTLPTTIEGESTTVSRSIETVEEFDNEIPKNQVETLTA